MDYESSDILGSNSFPVRNPEAAKWSGFSKTAFFLALLLAAYVGAVRAWQALLKWQEKNHRLTMRRQHGIPDNDHRPFNVAYAAVLRARREEEVANNRVHRVDVDELYAEADRRAAPVESDIRQRKNPYRTAEPAWQNGPINGLPGRFNPLAPDNRFVASTSGLPSSSSHATNFAERYNPNPAPAPPVVRFADEIQDASLPRRSNANNNLNTSPRKHQKRALEEYDVESDVPENPKKTRVEGDEFIDGDEDAEWLPRQKRGEKRVLREEDLDAEDENASPPGRRVRGKRARKVSLEKPDVLMTSDDNADDMDVDEEDEQARRAAIVRGKKRDAGSSFGGEEDDGAEGGDQAQKTKRKRRTRKSDAAAQPLRGQKRDRDLDEDNSDGEAAVPGTPKQNSRKTKKRGKKVQDHDEDGSVDGSVSKDKGKGRPIGDEWESNGVVYKIGANGQRLRQALVKKAARRFTMPLDSQHPDKNANLEVCIETWLTEEEYNDFKSRHLLAWQDSPIGTPQEPDSSPTIPAAEPPSTPTPNPVAKGKNLLWDSPASPFPVFAPSPAEKEQFRPKAHFRQSIAADLGVRVNPFDKANALHVGTEVAKTGLRNGRRVGAVRETGSPGLQGLADSTNNMTTQVPLMRRTFSKWEKQDLEAKAMMKMREANQAKVKEKELKEKLEREKREREAAAAAPAIPTISLTKPPAISFAPSTSGAAPSSSAQLSTFSLAPTPAATAEPPKVSFAPAAPPDKPQQSTPNPFAAPASAAPTPIPNPFAKPSDPAPTLTAAAASNPFAPPSTTGASSSKPSFSFPAAPAAQPKTMFAAPADRPIAGSATRKPSDSPFNQPQPPSGNNAVSGSGPMFSFSSAQNAPTGGQNTNNGSGEGQAQSGNGPSLLSRLGGGAPQAASKPAETSSAQAAPPTFSFKPVDQSKSPFAAPQQPQQQPKAAENAFSFKPTGQSQSAAPGSAFAPPQQQRTASQGQTQAPAGAATPPAPKFNFAFAAKPAAPASSAAASSSSLTGALGSSEPKPAAGNAFSFAAAKPAEKQPAPAESQPAGGNAFSFAAPKAAEKQSTTVTPPAFGFTPASGSAFGTPTPAPTPAGGEGEQKKNAFGFGFNGAGGGAAASSAFGAGSSNNTSSAFGAKSAFGGFGAKPAEEAPKATPAFGTPATNAPSSSAAPAPAPAFNFAFGGNNANNASTTPAGTPTGSSPFAAKPSAFGGPSIFGKPAEGTSTTPQGSPFGAGASSSSIFGSKPATSTTTSAFGGAGGATSSLFGGNAEQAKPADATTSSPSPFGAPATFGNSAGNAGPSAFGFGAPATGFKFGAPASGQQK